MSKAEVRYIVSMPLYELKAMASGWQMENSTDGVQESLLRKRYQDYAMKTRQPSYKTQI